jgi:O-antigen/teichoic acid export membrane protein
LPPYRLVITDLEHYTNQRVKDIDCTVVTKLDAAAASRRSLPRDALVLAVAMAVANATNYGFSLAMAFLLGPAAYGALGALLALVLVGSVPGVALQAVVARRTALLRREQGQDAAATWRGTRWLVDRAGVALAAVTVLAAPGLVAFLHLDSAVPVLWLALALAPTPLLFAVQGVLQGRERFGALAVVMVSGAAAKLAAGLALVAAGFGVAGALAGVAAGGALAALVGLRLARPAASQLPRQAAFPPASPAAVPPTGRRSTWDRTASPARRGRGPGPEGGGVRDLWREVGGATVGLLGLFLLANLDVLLARHYLDATASGRYALGAVVAKVAFWGPQFVTTLVFPRLVVAADPRRLLGWSALLVAGFGGLLAAALAAAVRLGLDVPVLGQGYAGLGPLLPLFAALGTGQALVQLLLFEGIATRDRRMGRAVAAALAAEAALVAVAMHGSVAQVVTAALAVVAALVGAGWWLLHRRLAPRAPIPAPAP